VPIIVHWMLAVTVAFTSLGLWLRSAARRRPMISPLLAHVGHWYQSLLYLAPVLIVVPVVWVQERRARKHDANAARDDLTLRGNEKGQ
jgi:hypothetical protein